MMLRLYMTLLFYTAMFWMQIPQFVLCTSYLKYLVAYYFGDRLHCYTSSYLAI